MCNYKAFIATKDGKLHEYNGVDKHEEIIIIAGLKRLDQPNRVNLVRLELLPPTDLTKIGDSAAWNFKVDQDIFPDWFVAAEWEQKCRAWVDDQPRIEAGEMVDIAYGHYLYCLGQVRLLAHQSSIRSVSGSAKINYVSGSAKIDSVYDSAKIGSVSESAKIGSKENK